MQPTPWKHRAVAGTATLTFQASDDSGNAFAIPPATVDLPASFFFNDPATAEIYTLSLHDALPISVLVNSDQPIVAERPIYFQADPALGAVVGGGHDVVGAQIQDIGRAHA